MCGFGWYARIRAGVLGQAGEAARREGQPRCSGLSVAGDTAR